MPMDMNNIVQNIDLSLIIPPKENLMIDEEFQKLVDSIRTSGILEPLLLRPVKEKYEIVIGSKRYEAAKLLGMKKVPSLIRNVDDDVIKQYKMINNYEKKKKTKLQNPSGKFINNENVKTRQQTSTSINSQTSKSNRNDLDVNVLQTFNQNSFENINNRSNQKDIVNLSELNQKENERDDFKMNNTQINNNGMNNNMPNQTNNIQPQEPTFGGRFFPSLEDEPTNMNMGGMNLVNNSQSQNNNLIDLTDIGIENPKQSQNLPPYNSKNTMEQPIQTNTYPNNSYNQGLQQEQLNPIPSPIDNIISTQEVSNQNQIPSQIQNNVAPLSQESTTQNTIPEMYSNIQNLNQNVEMRPQSYSNIEQNYPSSNQETFSQSQQFDMSQNVAPTDLNYNQPSQDVQNVVPKIVSEPNTIQNINSEILSSSNNQQLPTTNQDLTMTAVPSTTNDINTQKNAESVINIIKNLGSGLSSLGYQISINEENLVDSIKLTIEVEK